MKSIIYYFFAIIASTSLFTNSITFAGKYEEVKQETHGNQSPAIIDADVVKIIYQGLPKEERELLFKQLGNSQQLIDRLIKELEAKKKESDANRIELKNKEAEIQAWVKRYDDLKEKYYKLSESNKLPKKALDDAKAAMIDGDLKKAKSGITLRGVSMSGVSIN